MRLRSLLRPALALGIATGVSALVAGAPAGRAESGAITGFDYFGAISRATGIAVGYQTPALPIQSATASSVYAQGNLESTGIAALASLPYPSDAVLSAPGTAAGFAHLKDVPGYPLAAQAQDPFTPDATAALPDSGAGTARVVAHADPKLASAAAYSTNASDAAPVLAATGVGTLVPNGLGGFSAASITSTVREVRTDPGTFTATATSVITDLRLAGGAVQIGSVTSEATAGMQDGKPTASAPPVTVQGVIVAGTPASVTDQGLVIGPTTLAVAPTASRVLDALTGKGVTVAVTPSRVARTASGLAASGGSLEITFHSSLQGLPAEYAITFGQTTASVGAEGPQVSIDLPALETSPPPAVSAGPLPILRPATALPSAATAPSLPRATVRTPLLTPAAAQPIVVLHVDWRSLYWWPALALLVLFFGGRWLRRQPGPAGPAQRSDLRDLWRW